MQKDQNPNVAPQKYETGYIIKHLWASIFFSM